MQQQCSRRCSRSRKASEGRPALQNVAHNGTAMQKPIGAMFSARQQCHAIDTRQPEQRQERMSVFMEQVYRYVPAGRGRARYQKRRSMPSAANPPRSAEQARKNRALMRNAARHQKRWRW